MKVAAFESSLNWKSKHDDAFHRVCSIQSHLDQLGAVCLQRQHQLSSQSQQSLEYSCRFLVAYTLYQCSMSYSASILASSNDASESTLNSNPLSTTLSPYRGFLCSSISLEFPVYKSCCKAAFACPPHRSSLITWSHQSNEICDN
jgi:hypothetical protein